MVQEASNVIRSANPALNDGIFTNVAAPSNSQTMTLTGVSLKSGFLLFLVIFAASYPWAAFYNSSGNPSVVMPYLYGGMIGGFIVALITIFAKKYAMFTAPIYAILEGLFIGSASALTQAQFPDVPIVLQAAGLTFLTFGALLFCYATRLINPSRNFLLGISAATGGIVLIYLLTFVLSLFGIQMPFIHDTGPIGIGISLLFTAIAALNLVIDFDFIERGVERGAPKYMEWYAAFGLLVTLVWLYIEMLRLMAKLNSRR